MDNRIELTHEHPTWDPHSLRFEKAEEAMFEQYGILREPKEKGPD